jgi:hypothetical protein
MFGFILAWDLRAISGQFMFIEAMIWSILTQTGPWPMRMNNAVVSHLATLLAFIAVAIIINLGLLPDQVPPSSVTLITITSAGKFPISIDAYAILNQSVTTLILLEINMILHGRGDRIMFARVSLRGKDLPRSRDSEPDWDVIRRRIW